MSHLFSLYARRLRFRATPSPRPVFWTCLFEETSRQSSGIQPHAQLRMSVGPDMRAAPTRILFEVTSRMQRRPPLALRGARLGRRLCSRRETVKLAPHPCQQAAAFLACTRPPDLVASRRSFTVFAPAPSSSSTSAATSCLR
jgi:hypothetical protein